MAFPKNLLEIRLECDYNDMIQQYRVSRYAEGKQLSFGDGKQKISTVLYQDQTGGQFRTIDFFIQALKQGKVYDVYGQQVSLSKFKWKLFLTSKYHRVGDIPPLEQLSEEFKRFVCTDEVFAEYLSANDGEECKDLFANYSVMIDLSQQVWKRRELLDFLQQKPSAVLDQDSDPEVYKQFAQFEDKLFGLLKE